MPDPTYGDTITYRWVELTGNKAVISNGGRTVLKNSTSNNWDCLCVCKIKSKYARIKISIDDNNVNDNSGLCVCIIDDSMVTSNNYSGYYSGISPCYNSSLSGNYVKKGDILEFIVNEANDTVDVILNGKIGNSTKKLSAFTKKPFYVGAYLYYTNNKLKFFKEKVD